MWRKDRQAKRAWLFGLRGKRKLLEQAMERGDVIPKDPRTIQATPPRLIGRPPLPPSDEPIRLALIRQRAEAMRRIGGGRVSG